MELSNSTIVSDGSSDRNVSNFIILAFSVPLIGVESFNVSVMIRQAHNNSIYFHNDKKPQHKMKKNEKKKHKLVMEKLNCAQLLDG